MTNYLDSDECLDCPCLKKRGPFLGRSARQKVLPLLHVLACLAVVKRGAVLGLKDGVGSLLNGFRSHLAALGGFLVHQVCIA